MLSVLFLLIAVAHSIQLIRYRTWWMSTLVVGLYGECYGGKTTSILTLDHQSSYKLFYSDLCLALVYTTTHRLKTFS